MPLSKKKIKEIIKKYKKDFEDLEWYDKTREIRWGRARIDLTLDRKIIRRLKQLKAKTGKPVSRIIEEAVAGI